MVVGQSTSDRGGEAYRWTQSGGIVGLGAIDTGASRINSTAWATSWDGSVIVGQDSSAGGDAAFIWDELQGMRSLQQLLIDDYGLGSSLAGWILTNAVDVSDDGSNVVGTGLNPDGQGCCRRCWWLDSGSRHLADRPR